MWLFLGAIYSGFMAARGVTIRSIISGSVPIPSLLLNPLIKFGI